MTIFEYCHNVLNNNYQYIATEEANGKSNIFIGKISLTLPYCHKCPNKNLIGCRNKGSFVFVVGTFE